MRSLRIKLLMLWLSFRCALLRKRIKKPVQFHPNVPREHIEQKRPLLPPSRKALHFPIKYLATFYVKYAYGKLRIW